MPSFYPIHVNIKGKKCLVIGGGKTATRKISTLLRFGGKVVIVSPMATQKIEGLSKKKKVLWHKRVFKITDLNRAFLIFCATNSEELNRKIGKEARKRGVIVNVVDSLEDCDFISPSLVERGHLKVSISTEGMAPLLSRKIRKELEENLGKEYQQYTALIAKVRSAILKNRALSVQTKRKKLDCLLSLNLVTQLKRGKRVSYMSVLRRLGVSE